MAVGWLVGCCCCLFFSPRINLREETRAGGLLLREVSFPSCSPFYRRLSVALRSCSHACQMSRDGVILAARLATAPIRYLANGFHERNFRDLEIPTRHSRAGSPASFFFFFAASLAKKNERLLSCADFRLDRVYVKRTCSWT